MTKKSIIEVDVERNSHSQRNIQHVITENKASILKEKCYNLMMSKNVTAFMTIVTVYALYSDDVRVLAFEKSADNTFSILSSSAIGLFLVEIILQSYCVENYMRLPNTEKMGKWSIIRSLSWTEKVQLFYSSIQFGSFYFWLDLLATASMLFEVLSLSTNDYDSSLDSANSARAGRASRAGAKAARIIRVVRMIRLVRLVKLYKYFSGKKNQKEGVVVPVETEDDDDDDIINNIPNESHVGAEMSDRTTKKVILGCLIMLIVIPLLQVDDIEYLNEYRMQMVFERRENLLTTYVDSTNPLELQSASASWEFVEDLFLKSTNCIQLKYFGFEDSFRLETEVPDRRASPAELRALEKNSLTISNDDDTLKMLATFDLSRQAKEESLLSILLTTFIIILLAVGTMTFSRDVNSLVIIPIEKMVQLVREISANPLGKDFSLTPQDIENMDDGMETTLLLRTISKIAGLMRVGFGEAGAEIIGRNLSMSHDAMNLLGNGTKIQSIFGFCDVRNFTDTTECLQEEVMLFVNRIAHILHSIVVQCGGAANKNIGDAFLLTWKIDPLKLGNCEDHGFSGDKALYSLLKTMIEMNRHSDFICNFSPSSLGALYARIPGYECRIGCGLHFGWAIEGAIGSDKKIDASYISPHVNWAEFLESSTKEYGVPILMSEPFFKLLSPSATKYCRQVDRIKKSVNEDVVSLYTYDADLDSIIDTEECDHAISFDKTRKRTVVGQLKQRKTVIIGLDPHSLKSIAHLKHHSGKSNKSSNTKSSKDVHPNNSIRSHGGLGEAPDIKLPHFSPHIWDKDSELLQLRAHFGEEHREIWSKAISAFIDGDWSVAIVNTNKILEMTSKKDGPSKRLLSIMEKHNFTAPAKWPGYLSL